MSGTDPIRGSASGAAPAIDPQMLPILEQMRARIAERGPPGSVPAAQMRARFNADVAAWNEDPPPLPRIEDGWVEGAAGPLCCRLYDPHCDGRPLPCVVYFHGGGWVVGDLDSNDRTLRLLARDSGAAVVSVDYRLAPEHRFPAPLEDCVAAIRHLHRGGRAWGLDGDRLAVCGDSAGANLALAAAIDLHRAGEDWLRLAVLVYGAFAAETDTESYRLFGGGEYGFGTEAMQFFWSQYLPCPEARHDPRAAPLYADLRGLPPVFLVAADLDPLRDDTLRLNRRLAEADVAHALRVYTGVVHGFWSMTRWLDQAVQATREAGRAVAEALETARR